MDYLNLISRAQVVDADGYNVGEVTGFSVTGNRMTIKIVVNEGWEFDDDDGGHKMDVEFAPEVPEAVTKPADLKLVGGNHG